MIALAISYSTDRNGSPLSFNSPANSYDINERYEILKELYDTELFVRKAEFSSYHMELIRMVVNDSTAPAYIYHYMPHNSPGHTACPDDNSARYTSYSYMDSISFRDYSDILIPNIHAAT